MKTLKFKTNINCGECASKATPFINKQDGIENWEVDTANPDKTLTVESNGAFEEEVNTTLQNIGFKAESVNSN
ncbi:heavy-metal-associated domain-containing protein [Muricauda oceani]|uniref:Heavy-metal-associated domain-containing protein n=1 Tax=Flagellimonas oceani TaxID=2698672 RepID=A0A6G7J3L4_9FLAO|nr:MULTISPECIES: heavy-metal-associated domain-containing protein [Allomuricauda]MBW8242868.1 heavy-metal-associated domain-containing protein [Allomuricauda oceani]QII45405.1 heavy-metal-associated domain-containing protein [Allomuricauda oceani]